MVSLEMKTVFTRSKCQGAEQVQNVIQNWNHILQKCTSKSNRLDDGDNS